MNEPDHYFWYKLTGNNDTIKTVSNIEQLLLLNESETNLVRSEFLYNGNILKLENLTKYAQGWYLCCLIYYNTIDINEVITDDTELYFDSNRVCSSTFLSVSSLESKIKPNKEKRMKYWLAIILVALLPVAFILLTLIILYKKYKNKYSLPRIRNYIHEVCEINNKKKNVKFTLKNLRTASISLLMIAEITQYQIKAMI